MRLVGARPAVAPLAAAMQAGSANHLVGAHPDHGQSGVPLFPKIKYPDIYPGVDLVYYGDQDRLEYDFVVAPGASWRPIRLVFSGAQAMQIDSRGDLKIQTRWGWLRHRRPQVYQQFPTGRREVSGHYVLRGNYQVGFEVGAYDQKIPLVIDPTLVYASYLGGSGDDYGYSVAVDNSGCAYTVGETWSANFPLLNPLQKAPAGDTDIFVTKWNAAGTGILYSTYIGGSNRDVPLSIAVDSAGNAYITGFTYSVDFPVTGGALRTGFSGQSKAFVLKLNPSGNSLIYSTFLGGSGDDYGTGIAVDSNGQAYVSGYTASIDFPATANAFDGSYGGGPFDGFFAELNAAGTRLVYATFMGGIGNDTASGVALDPAGNVYLTGQTQSSNFPTFQALQTVYSESDAFVVKLNASGQVLYSTYLGGTGMNIGTGIAADAAGNAYVAGYTTAPDFPVASYAFQPTNHGSYDTFVVKLSADGSAILGATYYGGSGPESASGIALDGSGDVFVAGSTNSIDLPLQAAAQAGYGGGGDAFVAVFDNQLSALHLSTYFGGVENETGAGIAADASGNAYLTGTTFSGGSILGIPVTTGAFQTSAQGGSDAFLAKFSFSGASSLGCTASSPAPLNIPVGGPAEPVGDVVLTCTGGTAGVAAVANIQLLLNSSVASGVQPQLLVNNPPPAAQVPNVNLFEGSLSGSGSISFAGVSFATPGSAATVTLRITNLQIDASTIPSPGLVVATVSASNSSPVLTVSQPEQIVANAGVALQSFVMSKSAAPANCVAPPAASAFLVSDPQALVWFQVSGAAAGDVIRADWYAPAGTKYQSATLSAGSGSGNQCFWNALHISGAAAAMAGAWNVNVYWNNSPLFSAPFTISAVGVKQLVWQNKTTRQANANYYGGAANATLIGWSMLNAGVSGWTVVGIADMNCDGVPDLILQNDSTRQVNVNYYGGAGGTSMTGWACLNCGRNLAGWSVVAVADMNGDGVPDLIWQNQTTGQVNVNYYGGSGGATMIGWAVLNSGAGTAGWHVVAAADFDGNHVPDLVWQNQTTGQVNVNYYGGSGGATMTGWAVLNSGAGTTGWKVAGAADFNGDGIPDLIWQNKTTGQVNVNYYGGARGASFTGYAVLNSGAGTAGWSVVGAL